MTLSLETVFASKDKKICLLKEIDQHQCPLVLGHKKVAKNGSQAIDYSQLH